MNSVEVVPVTAGRIATNDASDRMASVTTRNADAIIATGIGTKIRIKIPGVETTIAIVPMDTKLAATTISIVEIVEETGRLATWTVNGDETLSKTDVNHEKTIDEITNWPMRPFVVMVIGARL